MNEADLLGTRERLQWPGHFSAQSSLCLLLGNVITNTISSQLRKPPRKEEK